MKSSIRLSLALLVSALVLQVPKPAEATTNVSIGNVTLGTKTGSQLGRDPLTTYTSLNYCVTFKTDSQAMDYGFEVIDSNGVRPPFGSAFSSFFLFVPDPDWNSGSTLGPRTVCNSTTLENNKSYTIRAWLTSGTYATRGTWVLPPTSAPTAASYEYTPKTSTTSTTSSVPKTNTTNPNADSGEISGECPTEFPVRVEANGQYNCLSVDQYCATDQKSAGSQQNIQCQKKSEISNPANSSLTKRQCTAVLISRRGGVAKIQVESEARKIMRSRFDVLLQCTWFVMGSATLTQKCLAIFTTSTPVINAPGAYTIRAVSKGRIQCEGVLNLRRRLTLRGPVIPTKP